MFYLQIHPKYKTFLNFHEWLKSYGAAKGDWKCKIRIVLTMKVDNLIVGKLNSRKVEHQKNTKILILLAQIQT